MTNSYGRLIAAESVSFEVQGGEIFGFLGPNGAGKTTVLRMLTNLTRPTHGTATVLGMSPARQPLRVKAKIGIVPEGSSVFPELTAMGNMLFTGALYGLARGARKERAGELMSLLGLNDHQNKRAIDLSLGLKRRLTIAMSLMHSPQVIFLDEPTSGLDVESSRLFRDLLITLHLAGVTVFITTHNMEEANQLCHRIAIMNKGRLIAIDPPEQLKRSAAEAVTVEVGFHRALSSAEMQELATAEGVADLREVGGTYRLLTSKPPSVLEALYPFMKKHCLTPLVMNTRGPSLEEVFLKLTSERKAGE